MAVTYSELNYDNNLQSLLKKCCINESQEGFYLYGEKKYLLPIYHAKHLKVIEDFNVREDDIYLMGFQRSGTTLTQEIIWIINNDFDFEKAKRLSLLQRFPSIESSSSIEIEKLLPTLKDKMVYHFLNDLEKIPSPRFLKTHLPWELLPKLLRENTVQPKIVHIARDPKSVCVSHYHFNVEYRSFKGTLDDFCELFLNDYVENCPYWENISVFWKIRNNDNILYLTYNEVVNDMENTINRMCKFFNKNPSTENISKLKEHLQFKSMKNNSSVNMDNITTLFIEEGFPIKKGHFIRKGQTDSYKEEMTQEYIDKFDIWIKKNLDKYNLPIECII